MLDVNFTHSNCRKWTPCAHISCHYLPAFRIGYPCMALPLPLPPTISVRCPCLPLSQWEAQATSATSAFRCPCLPLSQWEAQATFRCFRLPLPLPPTISVGGAASALPLPLPPTISVGGSDLPLLPPSAALASYYLSGRLRPSAASAFRCPCLPLSQWEAQAPSAASAFRCPRLPLSQSEARTPSVCWLDTGMLSKCFEVGLLSLQCLAK